MLIGKLDFLVAIALLMVSFFAAIGSVFAGITGLTNAPTMLNWQNLLLIVATLLGIFGVCIEEARKNPTH
jgi:hypothetical protein